MKYYLSPSILAADFNELGGQIKKTKEGGANYLHFDVMDGNFVPSISFGMPVLASIKDTTNQIKDVHLMIDNPIRYVEEFKQAGADILTVHLEACKDVEKTLDAIKDAGMKVGLSIKPSTPIEGVKTYLPLLDMILIMSVEPGFGGQSFLPESINRIRAVRKMIEESGKAIDLEVDGGIYLTNVRDVLDAGVNIVVAGSAIFKGDALENSKAFMEIIENYE